MNIVCSKNKRKYSLFIFSWEMSRVIFLVFMWRVRGTEDCRLKRLKGKKIQVHKIKGDYIATGYIEKLHVFTKL